MKIRNRDNGQELSPDGYTDVRAALADFEQRLAKVEGRVDGHDERFNVVERAITVAAEKVKRAFGLVHEAMRELMGTVSRR